MGETKPVPGPDGGHHCTRGTHHTTGAILTLFLCFLALGIIMIPLPSTGQELLYLTAFT